MRVALSISSHIVRLALAAVLLWWNLHFFLFYLFTFVLMILHRQRAQWVTDGVMAEIRFRVIASKLKVTEADYVQAVTVAKAKLEEAGGSQIRLTLAWVVYEEVARLSSSFRGSHEPY